MGWSRLQGEQYVRLGPGAADAVAPYVGVVPTQIDELLLDISPWPEQIWPAPVRGWDGRLIAGDPVLLDANDDGLFFAAGRSTCHTVFVDWQQVQRVEVVGCLQRHVEAPRITSGGCSSRS
ncbi:MAG: hypothetical protein NVS2B16_02310 [Chloroflexota bacterium]